MLDHSNTLPKVDGEIVMVWQLTFGRFAVSLCGVGDIQLSWSVYISVSLTLARTRMLCSVG